MSITSRCVENVHAAMGGKLDRDQVKGVVESLADMADRDPDLTASYVRKLKNAARRLTEEEVIAAKREKIQRGINILRRKEIEGRLTAGEDEGRKASTQLSRINVGDAGSGTRVGASVDAQAHAKEAAWTGGLLADLRRDGVLPYLTGGMFTGRNVEFERNVWREMSRLNGGREEPTGSADALKVAKILNKYGEAARLARNAAGSFIGKLQGYVVAQTHDRIKIAKAGLDQWKRDVVPLLDPRTFDGVGDRGAFLDGVYANLATGNHMTQHVPRDTGAFNYIGPGNLANRLSQERVLHFKDAAAGFEYNEKFGIGSVYDGALGNLRAAARQVAVMETWGTNPEAMFRSVIDGQIVKAKASGDFKEVAALETGLRSQSGLAPGLLAEFQATTGAANIPGNPTWAERAQGARNLVAMSKLGGMVLSQFSDIAARAATLRHNGVNLLEGFADGFASLARGRGSDELRDAMNGMGFAVDGVLGSAMSRFAAADSVPGTLSKMTGRFMQLTGGAWWQDAMETGMGRLLSKNLADRAGESFEQLPRLLQTNFKRYGISAAEWDALRSAPKSTIDGVDLLLTDSIEDAALRNTLQTYFVDQSREAMTMPTARQRAWITQWGPPGSLSGEVARFLVQFKTFSFTYIGRHVAREIQRDGVNGVGIAWLIGMSTVLGYASMAAKDLAKGRTPRDPSDPAVWAAAMAQGGGAGIYGDFILGQYNRFGGGLAETLAGPAVGTVADWASIFAKARDAGLGDGTDPGRFAANALRTGVNSLPFANLVWSRIGLDYLFLWQIQEALDPGSLKRMEQRVGRENNQEFLIRPSRDRVVF
jgi:hypothetical protein